MTQDRVRAELGLVALGGAAGAAARWGLSVLWPSTPGGFPVATFVTSSVGALLTGVLGGFTTFSGYAVEVRDLTVAGNGGTAAGYLVLTLAVGLPAFALGIRLGGGRDQQGTR